MSRKIKDMTEEEFMSMMNLLQVRYFKLLELLIQNYADDEYLSIEQACEILNYSRSTVYQMVRTNKIPFYRKGRMLIFSKRDLVNWIRDGRNENYNKIKTEAHEK